MEPAVCKAPDRHPVKPGFQLPARSTDCHFHVFDENGPSTLDCNRSYSPSIATEVQRRELHGVLGIERGVIVQPSVYGTDNATTLAVAAQDPDHLRAIVVVDQDINTNTLLAMHEQGARGVRVNMLFSSSATLYNLQQLARTLRSIEQGWHIQILCDVSTMHNLHALVTSLDIDVVFDHMGHLSAEKRSDNPGLRDMLRLLEEDRCWVKLSGAYRLSQAAEPPYTDVDVFAKALVASNADRLVWGSDWPHPQFNGSMPNDGVILNEFARWVPDTKLRNRILVDNATRLYGF